MQVHLPLIIPEGVTEALGLLFDLFDNSSWVARSGASITSAVLHQLDHVETKQTTCRVPMDDPFLSPFRGLCLAIGVIDGYGQV